MNDSEIKRVLKEGSLRLGVYLTDGQIELFLRYLKELKVWNKKINLTSVDTDREIVTRHFIDSLTIYPYLGSSRRLLDVGSGAGFPGIPLKIVNPGLEVVLMDSVEKKVHFMRHIIRTLDLKEGIEAVSARVEDPKTIEKYRAGFDCAVSRAFSELRNFIQVSLPYLKTGGRLIAIKGPAVEKELKEAGENQGVSVPQVHEVAIPFENRTNTIIIYEKIG